MKFLSLIVVLSGTGLSGVFVSPSQIPSQAQQPASGTPPSPATPVATSPQGAAAGSGASPFSAQGQPNGLNIVVLYPAHGGTDPAARGTRGIPQKQIVIVFAVDVLRGPALPTFSEVATG